MSVPDVAAITFRAGIGGEPILQEMRPTAAHTFQTGRWGATVIAAPGHPVGGDRHGLQATVGVGCCAEIRSAAPSVGRAGPPGTDGSRLSIRASVATDAMLTWRLEPGVAGRGCDHRVDAEVDLAANARLLWRDEFTLERRPDAAAGTWTSYLRVTRDSWPVTCAELAVGPGSPLWESPVALARASSVSIVVVVDPEHEQDRWAAARATAGTATAVALPLAGPGIRIVAWGDELLDGREAIDRLTAACGMPAWALGRWQSERSLDAAG